MKKVFGVISLAFVGIWLVDVIFNFTFRNASWGIYQKIYNIVEETSYFDAWIIGSSRAETAFETEIIAHRTSLSFFNAGIHGAKTDQSYYILKQIFLAHSLPKLVIFDIDVHNLECIDTLLNIEQFAPFLRNKSLRKNFSKIDKRVEYAYYFPMYELSFYGLRGVSKFLRILMNNPGRYDTTFQKTGCYHSHTDYQKDHYPDTTHVFQFHPFNLQYIDSAIYLCKKNNVKILFTVSPIYQPDENIKNAIYFLKNYLQKQNVECLDFSDIPDISYNINKFSDKYHLKYNGSVEFSYQFADTIIHLYKIHK
ncbi:MAG TPA: hypothetical protein PK995_05710 [Bacteroidia bacterium]|nr:hypothetical protein [Bacteroidia bacterium]